MKLKWLGLFFQKSARWRLAWSKMHRTKNRHHPKTPIFLISNFAFINTKDIFTLKAQKMNFVFLKSPIWNITRGKGGLHCNWDEKHGNLLKIVFLLPPVPCTPVMATPAVILCMQWKCIEIIQWILAILTVKGLQCSSDWDKENEIF